MATTAVTSGTSASATTTVANPKSQMKTDDFINLMMTQLQHQDPMNPTKDQDLLNQMSQIGQLQSQTATQASLQKMTDTFQNSFGSMMLQNQIGAAGNMIGKMVQGQDDSGNSVKGLVTSVMVDPQTKSVSLELDNGKKLSMANVTSIAQK